MKPFRESEFPTDGSDSVDEVLGSGGRESEVDLIEESVPESPELSFGSLVVGGEVDREVSESKGGVRSSDRDTFVEFDVGVGELDVEEAAGSIRFGGLREREECDASERAQKEERRGTKLTESLERSLI